MMNSDEIDFGGHPSIQGQIESWIDGYIAATDNLVSTDGFDLA